MNKRLADKLAKLPKAPGVYFHKDINGEVIYIGKAAVLRNRVRQYFQKSRHRDPKTDALISEIVDVDWIEVNSEIDALFLEAELIRRNLPRYNIMLRDDKSLSYVRINYKDPHPTVTLTRRPLDDGADYYGPYLSSLAVRRALKYLRRIFPFSTHIGVIPKRVCLQYHLGLCPGLEENKTSLVDYRANLRKLSQYLNGQRTKVIATIEKDMKKAAAKKDFESAATYRNQLSALKGLSNRVIFSDRENSDISKDLGLAKLAEILGLSEPPRRIEGYDISHMQGTNNTASMVVFTNGLPDKTAYRKFKMRLPGNDDFGHMREVIARRLQRRDQKGWQLPSLFLIDGGRGQLSSALESRDKLGVSIPMVGLAKREEEIIVDNANSNVTIKPEVCHKMQAIVTVSDNFTSILLPKNSPAIKLLQRIRDESHRFAVSYHTVLKVKAQTSSVFDEIPGVGPVTRRKLLKTFGSVSGVIKASDSELSDLVGTKMAKQVRKYLGLIEQ
jgi:excinuclease ABC subunit C